MTVAQEHQEAGRLPGGARQGMPVGATRKWLPHLLALAGYALATLVFTWPLALDFLAAIPGDSFDGWQNYWNQWWIKIALVDRLTWPLHTDILYAPTGVNLYFHTLNPFNGLASLPIQLVGGLIAAYNAVVFLSWILGGYAMFLLARWVIGTHTRSHAATLAAFLAGLVYTLSPFHMAHLLGHMQVMSLQWLPFYVLYLLRSIQRSQDGRPWLRSALLGGLFLVLNGLCDWYFVLYLLLFTGLAVVWHWIGRLRAAPERLEGSSAPAHTSIRAATMLWSTVRPALVAGLFFGGALSFWLLPMLMEAREFRFMVRPPADLYILSASLMDFLVPNRLHTLWRPGSFTWIGNQIAPISERTIAIGYTALALAVTAAIGAWRKAAFWWIAALFFLLLALGPQWNWGDITFESIPQAVLEGEEVASWTPYTLLNQLVPFMRISRSVSRFALMVQLCVAVLSAIGLHTLLSWLAARAAGRQPGSDSGSRRQPAVFAAAAAVMALVLFEYWVAPYPLSPPDTPAYYAQLAADPDGRSVLNLPMNYDRPGYLLYQTVHGKPLTVAYISRDDPRTLTERVPLLQHFRHLGDDILAGDPAVLAATVFADLGVGTVVLDRYKMPGGLEREYTEALAGRIFEGQEPVFADDRLTVYRVAEPAAPLPYLRLGPRNWGPRQVSETGQPERVLNGEAAVELLHGTGPSLVTIRYRTANDTAGAAAATLGNGAALGDLSPAPAGAEVTFALSEGQSGLLLNPTRPGDVTMEQITLE